MAHANIRKVESIWNDDRFGTLYLGQGSMSSDGTSNEHISGTTLVLYNSIPDTAGAFRFRNADGTLSSKTIAQAFGRIMDAEKPSTTAVAVRENRLVAAASMDDL